MDDSTRKQQIHLHRYAVMVVGIALFASGYFTAWQVLAPATNPVSLVQASEDHEGELAPFMIRNAYHFATLFHAGRDGQWELAAYEMEELRENLAEARAAVEKYAPLLKNYQETVLQPVERAIQERQPEQFRTAFQAAVTACNTCHAATQHAFIVIPHEPPQLSIFSFAPGSK